MACQDATVLAAPGQAEGRFTWEDRNPAGGEKASYYYVRVRQQNEQMAWASPNWVSGR